MAGRPGYDQATVLRRAIDVFNRQGYDGTSISDVANELGLTKSAIYHHVAGKEDLLRAALDDALENLDAALDAAEASDDSPSERLRWVVAESVRVLVDRLPAVTLLLRVRGNTPVELEAMRRRREIDARLAALVQAAVDEGSIRSDISPDLISRLVFGMVNSLVEWYRPDGRDDAETVAAAVAAIAFAGLDAGGS